MTVQSRPATLIPISRPGFGLPERAAVDRVLATGQVAQGLEVAAFEQEFGAEAVGGALAVAVNSGTSALHLGLLAAGIGPGDEVIVPSFTFAATANAVALTGATPVFADIDPDSYCLDPDAVESAVGPATRAILTVHLYGHPSDMDRLGDVAQRHGLLLLEDAAQAHGARWAGEPVGGIGAFGAFSFYPTKNMSCGEGGMVTTRSESIVERVRLLRNQGMLAQYANEVVGFNNRMTEIGAAIGRVQLQRLGEWTRQRQQNALFLAGHLEGIDAPQVHPLATHVFHQFVLRVPEGRDEFALALRAEHGIGCAVYYPTPVHRLASFGSEVELPETERACAQVLALPVHPGLSAAELEQVVAAVNVVAAAGS